MSELEFVAIQFGVKFVNIHNLQHYVDKVCQRYLHLFIYFENFVNFAKLLHDLVFILFYFISCCLILVYFSRSFYIIPYMDPRPWKAILTSEKFCCILIG